MTNPRIGEIDIEIAGKPYTIKPTFTILSKIEKLAGGSLADWSKINSIGGIASAFHVALVTIYGKEAPSLDEVGDRKSVG